MERELIPGLWGRCGRAIPDPQVTAMEDTTGYPLSTFPAPSEERSEEDDAFRAVFWQSYLAAVALTGLCVAILACWPN